MALYTESQLKEALSAALNESFESILGLFLSKLGKTVDDKQGKPASSKAGASTTKQADTKGKTGKATGGKGKGKRVLKPVADKDILARVLSTLDSKTAATLRKTETAYCNVHSWRAIAATETNKKKYAFYKVGEYCFAGTAGSVEVGKVIKLLKKEELEVKYVCGSLGKGSLMPKRGTSKPRKQSAKKQVESEYSDTDVEDTDVDEKQAVEAVSEAVQQETKAKTTTTIGKNTHGEYVDDNGAILDPETRPPSVKGIKTDEGVRELNEDERKDYTDRGYAIQTPARLGYKQPVPALDSKHTDNYSTDEVTEATQGMSRAAKVQKEVVEQLESDSDDDLSEDQEELYSEDEGRDRKSKPHRADVVAPIVDKCPADRDSRRAYNKMVAYRGQPGGKSLKLGTTHLKKWVNGTGECEPLVKYVLEHWKEMEAKYKVV